MITLGNVAEHLTLNADDERRLARELEIRGDDDLLNALVRYALDGRLINGKTANVSLICPQCLWKGHEEDGEEDNMQKTKEVVKSDGN